MDTIRARSIFMHHLRQYQWSMAAAKGPRLFGVRWWHRRECAKITFNECSKYLVECHRSFAVSRQNVGSPMSRHEAGSIGETPTRPAFQLGKIQKTREPDRKWITPQVLHQWHISKQILNTIMWF
jgi:hypothetical protein